MTDEILHSAHRSQSQIPGTRTWEFNHESIVQRMVLPTLLHGHPEAATQPVHTSHQGARVYAYQIHTRVTISMHRAVVVDASAKGIACNIFHAHSLTPRVRGFQTNAARLMSPPSTTYDAMQSATPPSGNPVMISLSTTTFPSTTRLISSQ